jgi:cytidyltransferase-like protein
MKKYEMFIGRYQPLHGGHIKLIRTVLDEGKNVCVALREADLGESNPYGYPERHRMFNEIFEKEIREKTLVVINIPDINNVCFGRGVGWGVREIKLDEETEKISATDIRKKKYGNGV